MNLEQARKEIEWAYINNRPIDEMTKQYFERYINYAMNAQLNALDIGKYNDWELEKRAVHSLSKILKTECKARNFTLKQMSAFLHTPPQILEKIEKENYVIDTVQIIKWIHILKLPIECLLYKKNKKLINRIPYRILYLFLSL